MGYMLEEKMRESTRDPVHVLRPWQPLYTQKNWQQKLLIFNVFFNSIKFNLICIAPLYTVV